ncbi:hypothetical protein HZ326_26402, partial [Fusarium oxysporum f. sp. albedinis]
SSFFSIFIFLSSLYIKIFLYSVLTYTVTLIIPSLYSIV